MLGGKKYNVVIELLEGESSYIFLLNILKKVKLTVSVERGKDVIRLENIPEEQALKLMDILDKYPFFFKYEYEVANKEKDVSTLSNQSREGTSNPIVKFSIIILILLSILFFFPKLLSKPTQKVVFCANYYEARGFSRINCEFLCRKYVCDVKMYIKSGWKIISAAKKEVIEEPFDSWSGCKCIGTEYILEK